MRIKVKLITGDTIIYNCFKYDTIQELVVKIGKDLKEVDVNAIKLIHNNNELPFYSTIGDMNLTENSTVHLLISNMPYLSH